MKLYDGGGIGNVIKTGFVETHAGNLHVYKDRTQAGDIVFITANNFKKYVPIEWINKWLRKYGEPVLDDEICKMIEDWEKENEKLV